MKAAGLSREVLLSAYRTMVLSRRLDDKEIHLKRQNRTYFQVSGAGHEAIQIAAAMHLKPGYDGFYPYYRDRALCLHLGLSPLDMLLQAVGAKDEPQSGGRQMPSHWSSKSLHIVTGSSPTGTQLVQAVGAAQASLYFSRVKEAAELATSFRADEVVFASVGEGATSQGEFWEAVSGASLRKLPVFFMVEETAMPSPCRWTLRRPAGAFRVW